MKVNFKNKNKNFSMEVEPSMTVKQVKQSIETDHADTGLKANDMKIIMGGKILKDDQTLEECGVNANAMLFIAGVTVRSEEKTQKSINQPTQQPHQQQTHQQQYQQPMQQPGNGMFNMGNESFKNLMSQQFDTILANPELFDQYLGPMFAGLDPATRESKKNQMLEQMRMMKDNPQMMEGILEQMKSMDPGAMQQMMNQSGMGGPGMGAPGMGAPGMGAPGMGMPNMGQQAYANPYMQTPQPSPTVPCSHGYYPYGYIVQPQMMYPPPQNMYQTNQRNVSPKFDPNVNYEERYKDQLKQLSDMGFVDKEENLKALKLNNGNVELAVNVICEWRSMQSEQ